jgi:hypothetical protein
MRGGHLAALALLASLALTTSTCRRHTVTADPTPEDAVVPAVRHVVLLGRLVDVAWHRVDLTLTQDVPLLEVSSAGQAFSFGVDGVLRGFRVSDGRQLWQARPSEPCRSLTVGVGDVFCTSEHSVYAYERGPGTARTVFRSDAPLAQTLVLGSKVATRAIGGELSLIDAVTGKVLARHTFPFVVEIVAPPSGNGVCLITREELFGAMCCDANLEVSWSLKLSGDDGRLPLNRLQQAGPALAVIDVSYDPSTKSPLEPQPHPSRTLLFRWSDQATLRPGTALTSALLGEHGELLLLASKQSVAELHVDRWQAPFGLAAPSTGSMIFVHQGTDGRIAAVEPTDGRVVWTSADVWSAAPTRIELIDGLVVIAGPLGEKDSRRPYGAILDGATGKTVYLHIAKSGE